MDALNLMAKINMDTSGYEKGLKTVKDGASKLTSGIGKVASTGAKAFSTLAKVSAGAIGAATVGVGALIKQSVDAYGEYEQMVGGVKKLYGNMGLSLEDYAKSVGKATSEIKDDYQKLEEAQNLVLKNAAEAYKTSGMSMNQYMDTATTFSASLIKSLTTDTVKGGEATLLAAKQTEVAMKAISDNFNTFGGDIGMIRGAFQGFAKQNYTMLDNLKLGYGGTKSEMQKLIADANEYAKTIGKASNLTIDSFSDIVTAIDLIQQKQQIAGTTAREATTTIQGSLGMLRSAWQNLLTGIADKNADIGKLIDNLVESLVGGVKTSTNGVREHVNGFLDNILPVVETALSSMGNLVNALVPKLMEHLPGIMKKVIPKFVNAGIELASSFVSAVVDNLATVSQQIQKFVPLVINAIMEMAPQLVTLVSTVMTEIVKAVHDNSEDLLNGVISVIESIISTITSDLPTILELGTEVIVQLIAGIASEIPLLVETITGIMPDIISAAESILYALITGITDNIDTVLEGATQLLLMFVQAIIENLPKIIEAAIQIVQTLVDYLSQNADLLIDAALQLTMALITGVIENLPAIITLGLQLLNAIIQGIIENLPTLIEAIPTVLQTIVDAFTDPANLNMMMQAWTQLMETLEMAMPEIMDAILGILPQLIDIIVEFWLGDGAKQMFRASVIMFGSMTKALLSILADILSKIGEGLSSWASKVASAAAELHAAGVAAFMALLNAIVGKIAEIKSKVASFVRDVATNIKNGFINAISGAKSWGKDLIDNFISGIKEKWDNLKGTLSQTAASIKAYLGFSEPEEGPLSDFHTYAPDMMDLFMKGIRDNEKKLQATVGEAFNFEDAIVNQRLNMASSVAGNSDLDKILSNLQIVVDNTMVYNGDEIQKDSYKYTVRRIGNETRAVRIASGGY